MANFGDLGTISRNARFQDRVNYALNKAAIDVLAESADTANHQNRVSFARSVLSSSPNLQQIAIDVLTNSTIAAESVLATTPDYGIPDSDIQFAINSIFNALSER